jgi:ADP-ribose pyrophosphatase YjhB (NUDIX family)
MMGDRVARPVCTGCGMVHYRGPTLLVVCAVFAGSSILHVRRGQEPYRNKWALPGGYDEAWESHEAAAVREVEEETGVRLDAAQLGPFGLLSVPELNQVHALFAATVPVGTPVTPCPPESLEAGWFAEGALSPDELWEPSSMFDHALFYRRAQSSRFDFYQRDGDRLRLITDGLRERVIWRRS